MLKQETFYEVQSWGCVSALLGLPAELIPHTVCAVPDDVIYYISRRRNCQLLFCIFLQKIPQFYACPTGTRLAAAPGKTKTPHTTAEAIVCGVVVQCPSPNQLNSCFGVHLRSQKIEN